MRVCRLERKRRVGMKKVGQRRQGVWCVAALVSTALCACGSSTSNAVVGADLTYTSPEPYNGSISASRTNTNPNAPKPIPSTTPPPLELVTPTINANVATVDGITVVPRLSPNTCVDLNYGTAVNGTPMQTYYCNGFAAAQAWLYSGGQLRIGNPAHCMDISGNDPSQATGVVLSDCDTAGVRLGQVWNTVDGMLQIANSEVCLTLPDSAASIQKPLTLAPCDPNNAQQQWVLDNSANGNTLGVGLSNGVNQLKCLDVWSRASTPDATVDVWDCNRDIAQQWIFQKGHLQAMYQCLQATGTSVHMEPCDDANPNQLWLTDRGRIRLSNSPLCIDLQASQPGNGTPLELVSCSGSLSQQWIWGAPASP